MHLPLMCVGPLPSEDISYYKCLGNKTPVLNMAPGGESLLCKKITVYWFPLITIK